ncbi:MAG TPA: alpha/beta fold hydrolase [Pirellulales bacterium]|nr:alpha/beta fold hydrolase [Pirellulales bacterium]
MSDSGGQSGRARTVKAGDVELNVLERGAGMPIVLLHGFPLDHSMWEAQIAHLAQRWHVIALDLRGFGGSQITPGTVTMRQMADDLNALLDLLAIDRPVAVCGLSMGGYVAFQFWRHYGSRMRALVLCDTRATADTPEAAASRRKIVEHVLRAGTEYVAEAMLPKLFAPATFQNDPSVIEFERQKILRAAPEGVAAALRGIAQRPDMSSYLPQISLPTLVLVGQEDAISTVDEMRGMAATIRGAEFVVIPNSGHMTPLENPRVFNEAIEQFLARVDR